MEQEHIEPRTVVRRPATTDLPEPEPALHIDEGEPLVARRTGVRDAHDRYARLETPPDP